MIKKLSLKYVLVYNRRVFKSSMIRCIPFNIIFIQKINVYPYAVDIMLGEEGWKTIEPIHGLRGLLLFIITNLPT